MDRTPPAAKTWQPGTRPASSTINARSGPLSLPTRCRFIASTRCGQKRSGCASERWRPHEVVALIVQRKHRGRVLAAFADHGQEVGIEEGFAADDRTAQPRVEPVRERDFVAYAGVRPEFELGKIPVNGPDAFHVAAATLDRIEVGDIQGLEGMDFEQGFGDVRGLRAGAQPGTHRAVFFAPAFAGMDYHSILEVDDGDQVEAGHG